MKVRVYALVKDLSALGVEITNKEMVDKLRAMGISVASHSSTIDEEVAEKVRQALLGSEKAPGKPQVARAVSREVRPQPKAPAEEAIHPKHPPSAPPSLLKEAPAKATAKPRPRPTDGAEIERPPHRFDKKPSKPKAPVFKRFQIKKPPLREEERKPLREGERRPFRREDGRPSKPRPTQASVAVKVEPPKKEAIAVKRKPLKILRPVSVGSLAEKMKVDAGKVIKKLMDLDVLATINQEIEGAAASLVASEFGYDLSVVSWEDELLSQSQVDPVNLKPRAPVVTIMGHVDHGKTSLLDAIRQTNVAAKEAGGITQHIGAYKVETKGGPIVFLDTPGHEAFTSMRARGAKVTDVVVLVVAADDSIMPQTVEAIDHARAAGVPIIVAVNKIDVADAKPQKVRQDLANYDLLPEEWGGKTIVVDVSAKEKRGVEDLLEMILLQSEILELEANPDRPALGTIIESKLDRGRGPVATVLVQDGTLSVGDSFVTSASYGKVRAMINDLGDKVSEAPPSTPVEVLGFSELPQAGDKLYAVSTEREARSIFTSRQEALRRTSSPKTSRVTLDDLYRRIQEGDIRELSLIIKGDVHGSVEAIIDSLSKLSADEVKLRIIHRGVGGITETDAMLASASDAIIIGFGVRPDIRARELAESSNVEIRTYEVIYDAVNDIEAAMKGLLKPKYRELEIGRAQVQEVFKISKVGTIAGCYVTDGRIERSSRVRLVRDARPIYDGAITSLKRFKDDVREVQAGLECGIGLENFNDIKVDDLIEAYALEEVKN